MATARTVTQIIQAALRILHTLDPNETVLAIDTATCLIAFQDLVSEVSGEKIMIPSVTWEAITTVASQSSYTVGENGSPDLSTVRPEDVVGAFVRDSSSYDYHVDVIGEEAFRKLVAKSTESRPDRIWYNPTVPNGTVNTYPTPSAAESLYISSYKPLTDPAQLTDNLATTTLIPRNYHNFFKWNLVTEVAEEYGLEPTIYMQRRAEDTRRKIENLNMARRVQAVELEIKETVNFGRSILTG